MEVDDEEEDDDDDDDLELDFCDFLVKKSLMEDCWPPEEGTEDC